MKPIDIARSFKRKVGQEVSLEAEGINRYIVYTPFHFEDGDHFVVILRQTESGWTLTDEGHTFMHLSYSGIDLSAGMRAQMIDQALSVHRVSNDRGELVLAVPGKDFGDALFSFVQALGRIAHTALWTRDIVKSTFVQDLAATIESSLPVGAATPDFFDENIDPRHEFPINYKISAPDRPFFVFGIANDLQCKDAALTCYHYEHYKYNFGSMAIYEDQASIGRRSVAQLSNVVGKQFSSLSERDRIRNFLQREVMKIPA